ncbi:integrin alpha-8-like isoform X4 [Pomacea canaliculata]|uniref:integrin alpha-8-like isoform X4 n=1 Tax=Pomacea canaliculata TaxID=400727 RepID=UPI000D72E2E2|nr:integrin alpha-8-like isoform X4 [Pomacea canaliculata]
MLTPQLHKAYSTHSSLVRPKPRHTSTRCADNFPSLHPLRGDNGLGPERRLPTFIPSAARRAARLGETCRRHRNQPNACGPGGTASTSCSNFCTKFLSEWRKCVAVELWAWPPQYRWELAALVVAMCQSTTRGTVSQSFGARKVSCGRADGQVMRSRLAGAPLHRRRRLRAYVVVAVLLGMFWESGVVAYNVDPDTALVHQGDADSMFGFSVAQHIDQSTNWMLIGAPRAQTSQNNITRGGAVFRCRTDRLNSCQEVPFDSKGNGLRWNKNVYVETEEKSNQWFGATVKSSGENGVIVACAPRYVYFSTTLDKREPVGTCYVSKASSTEYQEFSPCRTGLWGYHRQGSCQAGFSVSLSENGKKLLIGAVGSWYWQGQLYNYNSQDNTKFVYTTEGPAEDDDSYMGYASAVGEFDGDDIDDYVVGIPKGASHLGKIAIFTQDLTNINNITGEQIGAYFGAALAVSDLNGDGKDDIIVGAPFYGDFSGSDYETGRVYIYYQTATNEFKSHKVDILDGETSGSRFGMALTHLGDINYDGYKDLAVGAPYAGEEKKGAVYIFHGSKKGIITQVSQIIYAKDVATGLSTFGSALSGGWDQDGNQYPDLIVGSYASDKAVFLKTRPVVRVYASLKIEPEIINLEQQSCSLVDNTRVACLSVYSCLEYDGIGVPNELAFDASWELDTLQRNLTRDEQRAFYISTPQNFRENNTFKLTHKNTWCASTFAYVKPDLLDKLTPIAVDFKFNLHQKTPSGRKRRDLEPILDQYIPTSVRTEAQILKDCGFDNKCIPDLTLVSFRITNAHIIGSGTELEIMVIVENKKEDAFNTKLFVTLPPGVSFRSKAGEKSVVPVGCGTLDDVVVCDLGNPLPSGANSSFTLRVAAEDKNETTDALIFLLHVNSTNPEDLSDTRDNTVQIEIPVTAMSDITIYGRSDPEQVILNTTEVIRPGVDENRRVEHLYQLRNLGPSATKEIELQILWPSHDRRGNPILELDGRLQINGTGECQTLVITPENATKYGLVRPTGSDVQIVLQSDQDDFEDEHRGDGVVLACSTRRCTVIQCMVGYLSANDNFLITIKSRLNVRNFIRLRKWTDNAQVYHVRSSASARIKSLPYKLVSVNLARFAIARQSVITTINTDRLRPGAKGVEPWIIAVAISAGVLVLLLLILLLWWCGFFKRRKPDGDYMVTAKPGIDSKIYE